MPTQYFPHLAEALIRTYNCTPERADQFSISYAVELVRTRFGNYVAVKELRRYNAQRVLHRLTPFIPEQRSELFNTYFSKQDV